MEVVNFYMSHLDDKQIKAASIVYPPNDELPILNKEISELADVLFPIDPTTGMPENPVTKLLSPFISPLEKERIMATLQPMPASKRNNLSDDDLISMLPSRYNSTLVDMDAVRDWYQENIFKPIDDEQQQQQQQQQLQQQQQQQQQQAE